MLKEIAAFLSSIAFQNIILVLSAIVTVGVYFNQIQEKRRAAYRIVYLQLQSIISSADKARQCFESVNKFDINKLWQTEDLLEMNEWNRYKHFYLHSLTASEFQSINIYYNHAALMASSLKEIREIAFQTYSDYYSTKVTEPDKKLADECPITVSSVMSSAIIRQHEELKEFENCIPIDKLKRMANV